mmetsp:Transcript_69981/g.121093  ORF Transcript_69981/g.121093 Transcript_69981/m.121093 type:complete len:509 (-) Transcript_69981:248-1774(-)
MLAFGQITPRRSALLVRSFASGPNRWKTPITQHFINNEFVDSINGKTFDSINPVNEEKIATFQAADAADVNVAVKAAQDAFALGSPWRTMVAGDRRDVMYKFAQLIEKHRDELAYWEHIDNGKPEGIANAVDLEKVIRCYKYYAGWADKGMNGQTIKMEQHPFFCYTSHEPVGVCGAIIPWNFPLLMQAWKLGPALAAGCTVVMKTSEKTPVTGLMAAELIKEAGFPPGVVNILSGFGKDAGEPIAKHMDVDKVAFTGSTAVGHLIQKYAAESNMKRVSLECGGKSPMIICEDGDLQKAVDAAHIGLFLNSGQCCIASSRIFVQDSVYDAFVDKVLEPIKAGTAPWTLGSGMQGPQVDKIQFDKVMGYIEKGKAEGATLQTGGAQHGDKGYFVEPTVFTDVKDDMTIMQEEIFGPVMSIAKFSTLDEAVERANTTHYGLGAGIISENIGKALKLANDVRGGTVYVNCYDVFDTAAPFGGFRESGHGRDLGQYALDNYREVKTVIIPTA